MSKAASLIMENRYSIQEIAEMVGYSDTRTLRKHFTEQFGVSPSKYIDKPEITRELAEADSHSFSLDNQVMVFVYQL